MQAELLMTMDLAGAPANEIFPADINGDGRLEYLCLQSPGIYKSAIFSPGNPFWDAPYGDGDRTRRTDCCLTALDAAGKVLWRYGRPKRYVDAMECFTHTPDQLVCCDDINGDGRLEVTLIHGQRLLLLDGATGRLLKQAELESDIFGIVRTFNTRMGKRVLVKNTERGAPGFWYGDPAAIYDADLKLVARIPRTVGSGHSPRAFDLDDDGNDELLIGYEAYDADGRRLWRLDAVPEETYDPDAQHVDQLQLAFYGPDREPRIIYAGSRMAYSATLAGRCRWQLDLGHPQHILAGQFIPHPRHRQLVFLGNLRGNALLVVRDDGLLLNAFSPETLWPELPGFTRKPHSGEGMLIYPQGCENGCDAIILRDWGWPRMVDADGRTVCEFPAPAPADAPATSPRSAAETERYRSDRMLPDAPLCPRESYGVRVADMDGDGRAEVVAHNLRRLWVFKPPWPAAGAAHAHARLRPVAGQGWYALD